MTAAPVAKATALTSHLFRYGFLAGCCAAGLLCVAVYYVLLVPSFEVAAPSPALPDTVYVRRTVPSPVRPSLPAVVEVYEPGVPTVDSCLALPVSVVQAAPGDRTAPVRVAAPEPVSLGREEVRLDLYNVPGGRWERLTYRVPRRRWEGVVEGTVGTDESSLGLAVRYNHGPFEIGPEVGRTFTYSEAEPNEFYARLRVGYRF